jgi:hypothetical protein
VASYTPDWEPLADALKRVMAIGLSKKEAQVDLCNAIADGNIRVRVTITDQSPRVTRTSTAAEGDFKVPIHLRPKDFDWRRSQPVESWLVVTREWMTRSGEKHSLSISLIEVRTADVMDCIVKPARNNNHAKSVRTAGQESLATKALASHLRDNEEMKRDDAAEWLKTTAGHSLGKRAFGRVWPQAREKAGLSPIANPGRKRKLSR